LNSHVEFLKTTYRQDILAEEYIDGRELNVAVLGNKHSPFPKLNLMASLKVSLKLLLTTASGLPIVFIMKTQNQVAPLLSMLT